MDVLTLSTIMCFGLDARTCERFWVEVGEEECSGTVNRR